MATKPKSNRSSPRAKSLVKGKPSSVARRQPTKAEAKAAGLSLKDVSDINNIIKTEGPEVGFRFMQYKRAHNSAFKEMGFDAIRSTTKRRTPLNSVGTLDSEFASIGDRTKMIATARDLVQNYSQARGLINIDVNNIVGSGPMMQVRTKDLDWNARKEAYFNRWGRTCDIRGVMWWGQFIRTIQRRMVVDGDNGIILTNTGQLQGIEGDRIDSPPKDQRAPNRQYVDGVENDMNLRPLAYGIWKRGSNRTNPHFERMIPKKDFVHAFDPERFDQSRGVSHIISAINDLQDTREILEAVKGSMKLENILGLVFHSDLPNSSTVDPLGLFTDYTATDSLGQDQTRQEVKIGQGAWSLNLLPGEDVKAVQKQTPGGNFDSMMLFEIRMAGLALDMPLEVAFMYFSRGSFSSLRGALRQYHSVVIIKRKRLEIQVCDRIANWVTERGIKRWDNGDHENGLEPPTDKTVDPRTQTWQWPGLPLLDPDKERKSQVLGYNMASLSVSDICTPEGRDWQDVTDQRIRELVYMKAAAELAGIPPEWVLPAVLAPGQSPPGAGEPSNGSTEDMSDFQDRVDEAVDEALARLRE